MFVDKPHTTIHKMFVGSVKIRYLQMLSTNAIYKTQPSAIYKSYLQTNPPYLQKLPTNEITIYKRTQINLILQQNETMFICRQ